MSDIVIDAYRPLLERYSEKAKTGTLTEAERQAALSVVGAYYSALSQRGVEYGTPAYDVSQI